MTGAIAAVVAFFVLGGAALYWAQHRELERRDAEDKLAQTETDERLSRIPGDVNLKIGMKPREIYDKFAKATVQVGMMWRLYDKQTGRPIQHKTIDYKGRRYPAYVQLPNNLGVVRWLTLEDDHITNLMVGGGGTGSGFVISEQGYILTNKHVAAGWQVAYGAEGGREGILYDYVVVASGKKRKAKFKEPKLIDLYEFGLCRRVPLDPGIRRLHLQDATIRRRRWRATPLIQIPTTRRLSSAATRFSRSSFTAAVWA